jgi:NAD(P)-dependent dehydrogenase (short-subunit alcohol dehydrogenase family)
MQSALITGTSTGIGQATAVVLASRGWRVFATMRNLEKTGLLEQALKEAGLQNGVELEQLDVTSGASIQAAVESILARTGNKLDAVVHNAGVAAAGAFEDVPEPELRRVMETNFFGVLGLTRALLPTFRAQGNGRIILVSSEAAFMGQPTNSIYCASKWAIEGWAEAIAYELEPFGIEVILVEPGPYRTEIWKSTPRPAAHILHGYSRCSGQAMPMPRVWRVTRTRWLSSLPTHLSTTPAVSLSSRPVCAPQSIYARQGAKSPAAQSNQTLFGSVSIVALICIPPSSRSWLTRQPGFKGLHERISASAVHPAGPARVAKLEQPVRRVSPQLAQYDLPPG